MLSREQAKQKFSSVITNSDTLLQLVNTHAAADTLLQISKDLNVLIKFTESEEALLSTEIKQLKEKVVSLESEYVTLTSSCKAAKDRKLELDANLARIAAKKKGLADDIRYTSERIRSKQNEIDEQETIRQEAAVDWIPGVGFFAGLITQKYERMIPGYSTVNGIMSHINQEKEKLEEDKSRLGAELHSLETDYKNVKNQLRSVENDISSLSSRIAALGRKRSETEKKSKETRIKSTNVQNTKMALVALRGKYQILGTDASLVRKLCKFLPPDELEYEIKKFNLDAKNTSSLFLANF